MKERSLIALTLPDIGMGGAEVVNASLAKQFVAQGYRVDIVTAAYQPESRHLIPPGARHIVLKAKRSRNFLLPFANYLRTERPDVVIASIWPFTTICVLAHLLARSSGKIVVWEHNTLSVQYNTWGFVHRLMLKASIALTHPRAHARVAVSKGVADDLATLSGMPRNSISVIYNPLFTRDGTEHDIAAAEAIWAGWRGPRIITVGRLIAQKNHALLIRSFKKMLAVLDARLLILGAGALAEATAAVAQAENVAEKVLMPGETYDPTPYYRSADLFVLSSDHEGFGIVIVEALACGLPIVSTDCKSGPSEILEGGRYGRLVPVGDEAALAEAMAEALVAEHDRSALERRASDFAPERIARQYLQLLFPGPANTPGATSSTAMSPRRSSKSPT